MAPSHSRRSTAFRGSLLIILVVSVFSAVIAQRLTTVKPVSTLTDSIQSLTARATPGPCPLRPCSLCPSGQSMTVTPGPNGCLDCVCLTTSTKTTSSETWPCPLRPCTLCPSGQTMTSTQWPGGCWDRCVCTTIDPGKTPAPTITRGPVKRDPEASMWGQCGGSMFTGPTVCPSTATCVSLNEWYSVYLYFGSFVSRLLITVNQVGAAPLALLRLRQARSRSPVPVPQPRRHRAPRRQLRPLRYTASVVVTPGRAQRFAPKASVYITVSGIVSQFLHYACVVRPMLIKTVV